MPAATCKADLISVTDKEFAKLEKTLTGVDSALANRPFEDGWSIRDVVLHRAHWTGLFFQWLQEGDAAQMPDHGVKWNGLKMYNAGLRDRYSQVGWDDAQARLRASYRELRIFIETAPQGTLYNTPMPGGTGWTTGRYAEAAGTSHYRSATKFIRACLRAAK